ncbi:MAG TPA: hypothetical protein VGM31_10825 [Puia sp.]
MEFGKVQAPDQVNFQLPPDDPMTDELLQGLSSEPRGDLLIHVGASDGFGPDRAALLQAYLKRLPRDFRTCVELRQESWFSGPGRLCYRTIE